MNDGSTFACPEPIAGSYFVANYPPFSAWNAAGAEAYARALATPPAGDCPALGLYVHVPFCVRRCDYCYYLSYDDRHDELAAYRAALGAEIAAYGAQPALRDRPVRFAYVGGGTPSVLSPAAIRALFSSLRNVFPFAPDAELTFEVAPLSVTEPKLRALREAGVTRLSIGVQDLDDDLLAANGRVHRAADVRRAWNAIRGHDFASVNADFIAGLVGQTDASFQATLERALSFLEGVSSITVYQLEVPLNTPLYRALIASRVRDDELAWAHKRRRADAAFAWLEGQGFVRRSAYTAVRDPERDRFLYQDLQYRGADLIGIGPSAFGHLAGVNHQNLASLGTWQARITAGALPLWRGYALSDEERLVREAILQLKLGRLERGYFRAKFGVDPATRFQAVLATLEQQDLLRIGPDAIELTRAGLTRADWIVRELYLPEHAGLRYS